jgi:hypothetical protein
MTQAPIGWAARVARAGRRLIRAPVTFVQLVAGAFSVVVILVLYAYGRRQPQPPRRAARGDWTNKPMAEPRLPVPAELLAPMIFTESELERLTLGFVPERMEQRWFAFYEEPLLFIHRASSGECFYEVRLGRVGNLLGVVEAFTPAGAQVDDRMKDFEFILRAFVQSTSP